jgi:hypothetical protein
MLRPGIMIQHARESTRDTGYVRSDVVGFIAVVPAGRWPQDAVRGDYFELPLASYADLLAPNAGKAFFDPVTRRAVQAFFDNGGSNCVLFGLCVESEEDLMVTDPYEVCFFALMDRLREQEDIGLLAMPCLGYLPVEIDAKGEPVVRCQPVMELLLKHCKEMNNRFLILDAPRDLHDRLLYRWVTKLREAVAPVASYGALYYPWLNSGDEVIPPSGPVAGSFARIDRDHSPFGVRWPPANIPLRGVTHPNVPLRWNEAGDLTEMGINPIMQQPARGVVVWGARTLSRDPRWLHINSRRIVSYISEQLRRDSEWVVFENQRPELWEILSRMVRSRLDQLWGAGLLAGSQAGSEYLVQCDREMNPPEVVDAGQVHVRVVLRPISTTENIVVELRLGSAGSDVGSI